MNMSGVHGPADKHQDPGDVVGKELLEDVH